MIITKKTGTYVPHPEYTGQAVCVDVTPMKKRVGKFGEKDEFRLVFETTSLIEDGRPHTVSKSFTPSLHEKAGLRKFLKGWFGRDLTDQELEGFDTETLVGRPASLVVEHEDSPDGTKTYANIVLCRPDRAEKPIAPSGKYVRAKDRQDEGRGDAQYQKTEQGESEAQDWRMTKVHVGKHKGVALCELDRDAVVALIEKWVPAAKAQPKLLADDRRLMAALEHAEKELAQPVGAADAPY